MNSIVLILTGAIAATLTYFVNIKLHQGPVRSSAVLSLVVGLFFHYFPNLLPDSLSTNIPIVFIGSSFIGMVSASVVSNYLLIAVSGTMFSFIYLNTSDFFTGYGGGLGTAACISLLVTISLPFVVKHRKINNGYLVLRKMIFKKRKK